MITPNLVGKIFERLTVVKKHSSKSKSGRILWECICCCGNITYVLTANLNNGNTKSCGCLHIDMLRSTKKRYNTYNLDGDFGVGYTAKGEEFYFDLEDYDKIKDFSWNKRKDGYIMSCTFGETRKNILFHSLLFKDTMIKHGEFYDHINLIKNDNRKENLRVSNKSKNAMNTKIKIQNKIGLKGIWWAKNEKRWKVSLECENNKPITRYFKDIGDAINCRIELEKKYFGEYRYAWENDINLEEIIIKSKIVEGGAL